MDITKTPTIIILVLIVSLLRLGKETWAVSYRLPNSKGVQNGQVLNKSISKQGFSKETEIISKESLIRKKSSV